MTEAKQKSQTGELIKNAAILFVITLIAGVLLGIVYEMTKDEIARQEELASGAGAFVAVFPDGDNYVKIYDESTDEGGYGAAWALVQGSSGSYAKVSLANAYEAYDASGTLIGYIVSMESSGFQSTLKFFIGFTPEGHMQGVSITSNEESPGLGLRADEVLVPQFNNNGEGRDDMPFTLITSGDPGAGQISSIAGATITSNAMLNGVNAGVEFFNTALKGAQ